MRRWLALVALLLLSLLIACGRGEGNNRATEPPFEGTLAIAVTQTPAVENSTPPVPLVDITLVEQDVTVEPLPLRAGFPFSITAVIQNHGDVPVVNVPVLFLISARQETIGYVSFLERVTVTLPASQSLLVEVPVSWNLSGGEHQLLVQVNRLPEVWQSPITNHPEADTSDNIAVLELMVDPFDAYHSDLCPARTDVEVGPTDVLPEPDRQRVLVRVHNLGNRAVYNLPVVVMGDRLTGITYTPAIPPCGGTAEVYVETDRPFQQGESLDVQVNPKGWTDGLPEDDFENNHVAVSAGLPPGMVIPSSSSLEDYDFSIRTADIDTPEPSIVFVTVHNQGTRDAAMVPIRIKNEAGREITDSIPLVQGDGLGVAAIRVGYLWTPGGTLTFTINPEDAQGVYPESHRGNNVATFTLP